MRALVLGGGFGGIATAIELRRRAGDAAEIVLVDRSPEFTMGLRKLWELTGIATIGDGTRPRTALAGHGIRVLQQEIDVIDPTARSAVVEGEVIEADALVVALGAVPRSDLVPGLTEHGHDVWDRRGVPAARAALDRIDGGHIVVAIAGAPYPCPPAPFELAMLVDARLRERNVRERTAITLTVPSPLLLPAAGPDASNWIGERLAERGINVVTELTVERVDPGGVAFAGREIEADLVFGIPPHRPPRVVAESPLAGEGGWIKVDRGTLETGYPGVWAAGDATAVPLAGGFALPKAGVIAELQGIRVGAAIAALYSGDEPPAPYDGRGYCFVELGPDAAGELEGDFFAEPRPDVRLVGGGPAGAEEKRRFESERLERWFGSS